MCRAASFIALFSVTLAVVFLTLGNAATGEDEPGVLVMGDVKFPHELHYDALEIECVQCHHETNAAALAIPHEEYFADLWVKCKTCHPPAGTSRGRSPVVSTSQACSSCHHDSPVDLADETLSAKVVIHRSCWSCHEVGTGREASSGCKTCHVPTALTTAGERDR